MTVDQILTHVYTHEFRHQGQIQAAIRFLGRTPPNADWIQPSPVTAEAGPGGLARAEVYHRRSQPPVALGIP